MFESCKKIDELDFIRDINKGFRLDFSGKVIMHGTDTCYGLASNIFDEKALNKLYSIKSMSKNKPVSIMVRDLNEALNYAVFNDLAFKLAEKFWPGPLTMILKKKNNVFPPFFNPDIETIGIRCPDSLISLKLIELNGFPLTTTSANVSGLKEIYFVSDFWDQIKDSNVFPDYIIDSGRLKYKKPSTIVKIINEKIEIIREGDLVDDVKNVVSVFLN